MKLHHFPVLACLDIETKHTRGIGMACYGYFCTNLDYYVHVRALIRLNMIVC